MRTEIIFFSSRLHEVASGFIARELARRGITDLAPCHGDVLAQLYASDGCTASSIAAGTHRTKSTVSVLVGRLVQLGYVEKTASAKDSRMSEIRLTEKGRALRPVFEEISDELNARLLAGMKTFEAQALEDMLRRCVANLE